jgi:hypothetical protein
MTASLEDENAELRRANAELRQRLDERTAELELRTAERDEALARETATTEVLGVINSSSGELAPVFDAMLEKALRLCDAAFGFMAALHAELVHVVAERGIPAKLSEYHRDPYPVVPGTRCTASCMERT